MVTLKQLVEEQKYTNESDIQIIKKFFDLNNMESEGMDLIVELSKSKYEKLQQKERMAREWVSVLPSKYLYENYDLDVADRLHMLELDYLTHGGNLSNNHLKWAKENIPNIEKPQCYFVPLLEWLEEQGVRFKERC